MAVPLPYCYYKASCWEIQASAAMHFRSSVFWVLAQCRLAVYGRFGTAYRFHFQGRFKTSANNYRLTLRKKSRRAKTLSFPLFIIKSRLNPPHHILFASSSTVLFHLNFFLHIAHLRQQCHNTTVSQHKSVTTQQCHNTTVTTQQCHNTTLTTQQCHNTTLSQNKCHNTTVSQHNSVTTQQCHNTTLSKHNSVTTQNLGFFRRDF